jgi:putative transport protein
VKLTALALLATVGAALVTVAATRALGIAAPVAAGLFCGSLTNTPALAAAIEALRNSVAPLGLGAEATRTLLDGPTVGYSIAYPFGVIGLILAMQLATRLRKPDFAEEQRRARKASGLATEDPLVREVRVVNEQLIGKTYGEAMLTDLTGMIFTRRKRGEQIDLVTPELALEEGDVLVGVGSAENVRKAELLIGPTVTEAVVRLSPGIEYRDLVVINRKVAGTEVAELAALVGRPVIVSRIRRGGVQIAPLANTTLELGDQIRVVAHKDALERVTHVTGNPLKDVSETDFLSYSLGLVLGVAVGMIPIPFFGGRVIQLGFAGGPLVVGLVLGRLGRTGPVVWTMSSNASLTLRQLGILFFLAAVGTRSGGSFVNTLTHQGVALLLVGMLVTALSAGLVLVLARKLFHLDAISSYGILAGIHTQPAALAFASAHTGSDSTNISYAAVYPVALIAKIVIAQVLVGM